MDITNPDLHSLTLTVELCARLTTTSASPSEWDALTTALATEHTPTELANMLTGACTLLARSGSIL